MGVVHILMPNTKQLQKVTLLDISHKVLTSDRKGDERGFLSLAFHPDYRKNGRLFVYYSTRLGESDDKSADHKSVLSEFTVSNLNPNRANHDSEKIILEIPQPRSNHNGGQILFGYDGMLYLTLGDGGSAGDPFGQFGNGLNFARPEIYAYGVRNMWRCSLDRGDKDGRGKGRFFCGDVGQNKFEEIDLIEKGGNYGWRAYEANDCFDSKQCYSPKLSNAIFPIFAYNHSVGKSVVGGYVYRGCQNPNLYGYYIFGDTWSSRFFTLIQNKTTRRWDHREMCFGDKSYCTDTLKGDFEQFVLSFGEDEAGEIYLLAVPSPKAKTPVGSVYRLVDPARRGDPEDCKFVPRRGNPSDCKIKPKPPLPLTTQPPSTKPTRPCTAKDTLTDIYKDYAYGTKRCQMYKQRDPKCLRSWFYKKHCKKTCGFC
ncbi:HHIP-like protein 2 [Exaiptasia diaphana]|nr:HHIP-like protein 2 [Exaiptasia diaphana]